MHPLTLNELVRLGLFSGRRQASNKMVQWRKRKKVRFVGYLRTKEGRPEDVYCNGWIPKQDMIEHEIGITEICLRLGAPAIRGPSVNQHYRPDVELLIQNQIADRYFLEFDNGSMTYKEIVTKRYRRYRDCPLLVLWVARSEIRKEGLRLRSETVRHNALFTTFDRIMSDPFGEIWQDFDGHTTGIEKPSE